MKFPKEALAATVAIGYSLSSIDAFTPTGVQYRLSVTKQGILFGSRLTRRADSSKEMLPWNHKFSARKTVITRKLTDQDEDDEDYNEEPLAEGVNSVAWLPSVKGAKNVEISGAEEVSYLFFLLLLDF